jgi:hypothetical protein
MLNLQRSRSLEDYLWNIDATHSSHVAEDVAVKLHVSGKKSIEVLQN